MVPVRRLACVEAEVKGDSAGTAVDTQTTTALGVGDGPLSAAAVTWTPILDADDRLTDPRDLGVDPDGNQWIANRADDRLDLSLARARRLTPTP